MQDFHPTMMDFMEPTMQDFMNFMEPTTTTEPATTTERTMMTEPNMTTEPSATTEPTMTDPMELIFFTPAGSACRVCSQGFVPRQWRDHFRKHPHIKLRRAENRFVQKLEAHVRDAVRDPNRTKYAQSNVVHNVPFCLGCRHLFTEDCNLTKHFSNPRIPCNREMRAKLPCLKLKCGRFFPVSGTTERKPQEPLGERARETSGENEAPTRLCSLSTPHHALSLMGTMPASTRNKSQEVVDVLKPLLQEGEPVDEWKLMFNKLIAPNPPAFATLAQSATTCFHDADSIIASNTRLSLLVDAFSMLESNFKVITTGIPGNHRSALVKFQLLEGGDADHHAIWGFRPRSEECSYQAREFKKLIAYLYRNKCPFMPRYLDYFDTTTHATARQAAEQAYFDGIPQKFLFELCMEKVHEFDYQPWLCNFALLRCLTVEKGSMKMKGMGQCGSQFATHLYMMRQGIVSCVCMMINNGKGDEVEVVIRNAQKGSVINTLSPLINLARTKVKRELQAGGSKVNQYGDIICKNAVFRKAYYSRLIPNIKRDLSLLFDQAFEGDDWKAFLGSGTIEAGDDWFSGNIVVHTDDTSVTLDSLVVVEDYTKYCLLHQKITSYIEIMFHGLGGGGERSKTIHRIYALQVLIMGESRNVYFRTGHDKQASVMNTSRSPADHMLPPSVAPCFFLYRALCIQCGHHGPEILLSIKPRKHFMVDAMAALCQIPVNSFTDLEIRHLWTAIVNLLFASDIQKWVYAAKGDAAQMSNHSEEVQAKYYATLHIDQVDNKIATYQECLGESSTRNPSHIELKPLSSESQLRALRVLTCDEDASFYSVAQEKMINICCNDVSRHSMFVIGCGGGKSNGLLVPVVANYLSRRITGCRIMVVPYSFLKDSLLEAFTHKLSMTFHGAIKVAALSASDIIPDCRAKLPHVVSDGKNCPDILILTVDAAVNLMQYHEWLLQSWARNGMLDMIYFDEIQTMFTEFGFRYVYQGIQRFSVLGCPISLLSGSFHPDLARPIMKFLGLHPMSVNGDSTNIVQSSIMVGTGFSFYAAKCSGPVNLVRYVVERIKNASISIHIICKDATIAAQTHQYLKEKKVNTRLATAQVPKSDLKSIASDWFHGKFNVLVSTIIALVGNENPACREIIVAGKIYNLASLIQAIGRLRRNQRGDNTRVTQIVFNIEKYSDDRLLRVADENLEQLINAKVLSPSDADVYKNLFHYNAYNDFIEARQDCYVRHLDSICGSTSADCMRCTWCRHQTNLVKLDEICIDDFAHGQRDTNSIPNRPSTNLNNAPSRPKPRGRQTDPSSRRLRIGGAHVSSNHHGAHRFQSQHESPVQRCARESSEKISAMNKTEQAAIRAEQYMSERCPICKKTNCTGTRCKSGCYMCGDLTHGTKTCPFRRKAVRGDELDSFMRRQRICPYCYTPTDNNHTNVSDGERKCDIQERFRVVFRIQFQYKKEKGKATDFGKFVMGALSTRQSYFTCMAKCETYYTRAKK